MQTFLPYSDFVTCAEVLDTPRLGKQRVETLQILRALELPDYGWQNHPAVRMWRGHTEALVRYGLDCALVWMARDHPDTTFEQIAEFAPSVRDRTQADLAQAGMLPSWLGDERLHVSHRSRLIAKDPQFYRERFAGTVEGLDYFWPGPDPLAPEAVPGDGPEHLLWVLRPESDEALGRAVSTAQVGFGAETGIRVDVAGSDLAALRALQAKPTRRPSRGMRALADLIALVETGDDLAVLIAGGTSLLAGVVTGPYTFASRDAAGLLHRRSVRWERLAPRAAVYPPAALQDVRPLFRVAWNRHAPALDTVAQREMTSPTEQVRP